MLIVQDAFPELPCEASEGDMPVGILTFEQRCNQWAEFHYHILCFYKMCRMVEGLSEREQWVIEKRRMILLNEAEREEYRCDCPDCGKFLFDQVFYS